MAEYTNLPEFINLPLDEKKIKGDKEEFWEYFKSFVLSVKRNLEEFSIAFNVKPEYEEGDTRPTPADGQFLIWYDTDNNICRLLYGDNGNVYEFSVRYATNDETVALTISDKAVTPAGLGAWVNSSQATTDAKGLIELATENEVLAGEDDERAVTPATLAALTATEDRKGLVERATDSEAEAGTDTERYITPYHLKTYGKTEFPYVKVSDQRSSGTHSDGISAGSWVTRTLNTKNTDTHNIASLSSNRVTLPAGTYYCIIHVPAYRIDSSRARLYNVTNSTVLLSGTNTTTSSSYNGFACSVISGQFTLSAQSQLRVEHRASASNTTSGGGQACSFGDTEIYTVAEFWKLS